MKTTIKFIVTTAMIIALCIAIVDGQIAGNPPFTLNQSVIASGGGTSTGAGNVYKIEGTIGQPVAGTNSTNSPFSVRGGFFTPAPFGTTAAMVRVGGRILTADGSGISKVAVTMTSGSGSLRTVLSSSFGYFAFDDVSVGEVYIISVNVKQFQFSQNAHVIFVSEDISDIDFIANP